MNRIKAIDSFQNTKIQLDKIKKDIENQLYNDIAKLIKTHENNGCYDLKVDFNDFCKTWPKNYSTPKNLLFYSRQICKLFMDDGYKISFQKPANNYIGNTIDETKVVISWKNPDGWDYVVDSKNYNSAKQQVDDLEMTL